LLLPSTDALCRAHRGDMTTSVQGMAGPLPPVDQDRARISRLASINLDDLFQSFKIDHLRYGRGLLRLLFTIPARRFARMVLGYDRRVGEQGLAQGAAWILRRMNTSLEVIGAGNVPASGPVLLLGNHPGLTDTMALFSAIPRPDVRAIAAERPFLMELPHTSRQMIYVDEQDSGQRMGVLRSAVRHLREGGTLVTFPGGAIDPDPALVPGAIDRLERWSPSVALIASQVPDTIIVPVMVSGVISARALRNPLVKLYKEKADREWAAATLQLLIPGYRRVRVKVVFGAPVQAGDLATAGRAGILAQCKAGMAALIREHGHPGYRDGSFPG